MRKSVALRITSEKKYKDKIISIILSFHYSFDQGIY